MLLYQTENFGKSYEYRSGSHENWTVPPHIHEYSEILFTKNGTATVVLDGVTYRLPKGHMIFILPNQVHEFINETPSVVRCAVFSNDHIPAFFRRVQRLKLQNPVLDFSEHLALLDALERTDVSDTLTMCGLLNLIGSLFLKNSELCPENRSGNKMLHDVILYISQNFTEEITLKDIAARMGYHEKYLSSCLHSVTGMQFRMFLASYRVHYAAQLLDAQRDLPISEVAFKSGFSSVNTFNRCFRGLTGMTPTAYKKTVYKENVM